MANVRAHGAYLCLVLYSVEQNGERGSTKFADVFRIYLVIVIEEIVIRKLLKLV